MVRPPQAGVDYHAFADPSGGLGDSFHGARSRIGRRMARAFSTACIEVDRAVRSGCRRRREIAATLKAYGITKVIGDKYAAQWVVGEFSRNDITYEA